MSSWEDIANEVVPLGHAAPGGLATGPRRGSNGRRGNLGSAFNVERYLSPPPFQFGSGPDAIWGGALGDELHGPHYLVDQPVTYYDRHCLELVPRLRMALKRPFSRWLEGLEAEDLLFVDIETTGLSASSPLFLIGTMRVIGDEFRIQLFLARDFQEEKCVLNALAAQTRGKTLITFNGKSFDWPYIEGRAARWKVPLPELGGHFDLLFAARRRWRSTFPNCRLQTLEMGVCGRGREGDIPSAHIPSRYHQYLEVSRATGEGEHLLVPILFHNALDVLTMAELLCHLSEVGE